MAVTFDTKFEKGATQASPFSFVSNAGTVAGSVGANSNRVLIAVVGFDGTSATVGTVTVTWAGTGMTQITSLGPGPDNKSVYIFGLIAPATGAQTLSVSWTGGFTQSVALGAVSVFNADQVTGWQNSNTASGSASPATIVITTTNGDMAVAGRVDFNAIGGGTVTVGTLAWEEDGFNNNYGQAYNAAVGTSTTITWTLGSNVAWDVVGVSVMQSAAAVVEGGGTLIVRPRLWVY